MIDHFVIFSKTGAVLWSRTLCKLNGNPIDVLINRVLMEDRSGETNFIDGSYAMRWIFENKLDLVFVVVYQKILQLLYIEELLETVKKDFVGILKDPTFLQQRIDYDPRFSTILHTIESKYAQKQQKRTGPRVYNPTRKAKGSIKDSSTSQASILDTNLEDTDASADGEKDLENEMLSMSFSSKKKKEMRHGPGRKASKKKLESTKSELNTSRSKKKMTKWGDSKLSKEEIDGLDFSKAPTLEEEESQIREKRDAYIGTSDDEDDEDEDESEISEADSDSGKGWTTAFSNTRLGNFLQSVSGNKVLQREDIEPVVEPLRTQLISKNVAAEVADELCESVIKTVVGQRLESFTRVSTVVRNALEAALLRILTPKRSTDVLRDILEAKASGRCYSIVFVGVNGVGKSTSLSKVCYYLKSKGINVMIAACDTFRSGAVEQLNQHAKVLDVPLFQKGYAKDPASVARDAIKHGQENGYDCVLVDTAGRMQNNEPLMRALAKLVSMNDPDLVLFVGEALVGNDGIDQLSMFDRALADYSDRHTNPHRIDGIMLTKFDTIDDKVGAAVSMVYKTGQPVIFVGTGQKYTNLKKLNTRTILRHLLQ